MMKRKEELSKQTEETYSSTMIPFYDILIDKIKNLMKQKQMTDRGDNEETYNSFSSPYKKLFKEGTQNIFASIFYNDFFQKYIMLFQIIYRLSVKSQMLSLKKCL